MQLRPRKPADERSDAAAVRLPLFADVPAGTGPHGSGSKLPIDGVRTATCDGQTVLRIAPDALSELAFQAFRDVSHLLRPGHLARCAPSSTTPEASANDRFVALDLLKNANIAAGGVLPMCQDTGTAIVFGKKGQRVWVDGDEEEALSLGRASHLHRNQSALFADGAAVDVRGGEHRQQPAGAVRHHGRARRAPRRRVPPDVRRQGRRQRQQDVPVPGDAGDPVAGAAAEVPRRQDEDARDLGLPAVSPGDRDRRHLAPR